MKDCPYRLRMEGVPPALTPDGRCAYGCRGSDGPLCLELGPMTSFEIGQAAELIAAKRVVSPMRR